jgi:hypothetical protein
MAITQTLPGDMKFASARSITMPSLLAHPPITPPTMLPTNSVIAIPMMTSMRATMAPERPSLLRERFEKIGVGGFM